MSVLRNVGTTEKSKTALKGLGVYYDYPKPVALLEYLIKIGCEDSEGLVLDFFAGSGTAGTAVMNLNVSEGASRRFICVQLPEKTDEKSDAKIRGFNNLAQICRRRLEVVSRELIDANPSLFLEKNLNLGFRTFRLDSSNIRAWNPDPLDFEQTLLIQHDHLVDGRSESDILHELLLKLGLDLCVPVEHRTVKGKDVHSVGGGVLMACLATAIGSTEVEALADGIAAWHKELAPAAETTCVFRDSAFTDDVAKTNLAAILEQNGIETVRSL